jgi:uncharacterized membrane protein HdeD (DUF308 family)
MEELARGVVLLLFGIFLFVMPGGFFTVLLFLFGVAALVDGLLALSGLFRGATPLGRPRWTQALEAVAGIVAGAITLLWPGITAFFLLMTIAVWAIATGAAELAAGVKVERGSSLRSLEILRGALGLAFGVLLLLRPMAGGVALMAVIGLFGIAAGVTTIGTALATRRIGGGARRDPVR